MALGLSENKFQLGRETRGSSVRKGKEKGKLIGPAIRLRSTTFDSTIEVQKCGLERSRRWPSRGSLREPLRSLLPMPQSHSSHSWLHISCLGRSVSPLSAFFFSRLTCFRGRANWLVSLSSSFQFFLFLYPRIPGLRCLVA
jgi:hypothetical protein